MRNRVKLHHFIIYITDQNYLEFKLLNKHRRPIKPL